MISARNPDCAAVLQMRAAGRKPFAVKLVVLFKTLRFIPFPLVHAHLLPGLDRDYKLGVSLTLFGSGYSWLRYRYIAALRSATATPPLLSLTLFYSLKLFKLIVKISNSSKDFFKNIFRNKNIFQIFACHFALRTTCFY